jgi:hypothetical protein
MTVFNDQIQRIKNKFPKAKKADKYLEVSGASSHKYQLNDPATAEEVSAFEGKYGIQLPDCYKSFILQVGNAGIAYENSAAGPFYGIYPFGKNEGELIYGNADKYLKNNCVIYPAMSDQYWKSLNENIENNEDISDEDFDKELGKIFGGILPIGSQGCTYIHGIIIQGEYRGCVVNICRDRQKPQFSFEKNFLDWYERWLDEVISGELLKEGPSWFGYSMGGSDTEIIRIFLGANTIQQKTDCLKGILSKTKIEAATIQIIEEQILNGKDEFKRTLHQILTKFNYEKAKPYLIELAKTDLGSVCQFIYYYAKDKSAEWLSLIGEYIERIDDDEAFRFCTYILKATKVNFGHVIVPFTQKDNENIRVTAFDTLGQLKNKKVFLDTFIKGLNDNSNQVINITLQALSNVKDTRLLEHYKGIAERFPEEKDGIILNLNDRLSDYGLTNETILNKEIVSVKHGNPGLEKKRWHQIWK